MLVFVVGGVRWCYVLVVRVGVHVFVLSVGVDVGFVC